jgi:hypothetical protein
MLVMEDDDYGSALAPGTSTCMSVLALEEELLIEQDNLERVSLPTSLFIILQALLQIDLSLSPLSLP